MPVALENRYATRANGRFAPGRQWSARELKEIRALYIDKKVSAKALARLFSTTTTQIYRLAVIHDWPHRKPGVPSNPRSIRRLQPKRRELYYALRPTLGHDRALAEAWAPGAAVSLAVGAAA